MGRLVLDRHRPTMPELLARVPRRLVVGLAVLAGLRMVALVAARLAHGEPAKAFVHRAEPPFNFIYGDRLEPAEEKRSGEIVALEERRGELFIQSFAVRGFSLPAHRPGTVGGIMPIVGDTQIDALARRFDEFELVSEGKARINEVPGYELIFRARLGERRLYGRVVLLPEPIPGSRRAVALELLGTPVSGAANARDVGNNGVLKLPLRSFRFGVERP